MGGCGASQQAQWVKGGAGAGGEWDGVVVAQAQWALTHCHNTLLPCLLPPTPPHNTLAFWH